MKCPKCSYVSHDYLNACRKCNIDLVNFKAQMHLQAIQPGVLDLSLVLSSEPVSTPQASYARGHDDFFGSQMLVESEEGDDTFDISLDDDFGMTPTQIEQLRAVRPGDDDEAADILPPGMAALDSQETRSAGKPTTSDPSQPGGAAPSQAGPLGPPKSGYATVMIDLDDMEGMLDTAGQATADQKDAGTVLPPAPPQPSGLTLSALDHEELSLAMPEAEETNLEIHAAEDSGTADEITLIEDTRTAAASEESALELGELNTEDDLAMAELTDVSFEAQDAVEGEGEPSAQSETDFAELTEMSLEAQDAAEMEDDPVAQGEVDFAELTEMSLEVQDVVEVAGEPAAATDVDSAELTEMSLEVQDVVEREGELAAQSDEDFAELTEMSLEIQDAEDMNNDDQVTILESALEMPSLDFDAELTAEELFADVSDTEEPAQPLLDQQDEDVEDVRLEFDDLDLDDDKPFA